MSEASASCRDVRALAEAELQRKLAASVGDLRKGLSGARSLQAALRAEAAALESFIPVIVEGARSGMQQALAKQVRPAPRAQLGQSILCQAARSPIPASITRGRALRLPIWQLCVLLARTP